MIPVSLSIDDTQVNLSHVATFGAIFFGYRIASNLHRMSCESIHLSLNDPATAKVKRIAEAMQNPKVFVSREDDIVLLRESHLPGNIWRKDLKPIVFLPQNPSDFTVAREIAHFKLGNHKTLVNTHFKMMAVSALAYTIASQHFGYKGSILASLATYFVLTGTLYKNQMSQCDSIAQAMAADVVDVAELQNEIEHIQAEIAEGSFRSKVNRLIYGLPSPEARLAQLQSLLVIKERN